MKNTFEELKIYETNISGFIGVNSKTYNFELDCVDKGISLTLIRERHSVLSDNVYIFTPTKKHGIRSMSFEEVALNYKFLIKGINVKKRKEEEIIYKLSLIKKDENEEFTIIGYEKLLERKKLEEELYLYGLFEKYIDRLTETLLNYKK